MAKTQSEISETYGVSTAYSAADMSDEGAIADMIEMITDGGRRRLARRLDSGKQQGNQNRDNRNHNQQFYQRKTTTLLTH